MVTGIKGLGSVTGPMTKPFGTPNGDPSTASGLAASTAVARRTHRETLRLVAMADSGRLAEERDRSDAPCGNAVKVPWTYQARV